MIKIKYQIVDSDFFLKDLHSFWSTQVMLPLGTRSCQVLIIFTILEFRIEKKVSYSLDGSTTALSHL